MKQFLGVLIFFLLSFTVVGQDCPDGDFYTLASQSEVDSFIIKYPNCSILMEELSVFGEGITNLDGLAGITRVEHSVNISDMPNLTDISGLQNLTWIEGSLLMFDLDSLTNFSGLENLLFVGSSQLVIANNDLLEDITSLSNVMLGNLTSIFVTDNPMLVSCVLPAFCTYANGSVGDLFLSGNSPACELCGTVTNGTCEVRGDGFKSQADIDAFPLRYPGCTEITNNVNISE